MGSKAFGGLHRRLKEKTAESRWFETTGQAPFGRAKAAYWKINAGTAEPFRVSPPEAVAYPLELQEVFRQTPSEDLAQERQRFAEHRQRFRWQSRTLKQTQAQFDQLRQQWSALQAIGTG